MQAVYWIAIHPGNKFWLLGKTLSAAGSRFFSFDPTSHKRSDRDSRTIGPVFLIAGNSLTSCARCWHS